MLILSHKEILKNEVPELEAINYRSENGRNWLSRKQWEGRLRSIEYKNFKLYGRSLSRCSFEDYFSECIYEVDADDNSIHINEEAYKLIRKFLTSAKFNLKKTN